MLMTVIAAEANAHQAAHFAQLAQMAADNVFTDFFGGRANAVLTSMYLQAGNQNSHSHSTFLLEADSVAGLLQAYRAADAHAQEARTLWLYLRYAAWQMPRLLALGFLLRDLLAFLGSKLAHDDFYISFLAVYPPYRGRGHSKTLLNHASQLARQAGCARLALDVDERNTVARAAYQRAGFERIAASKPVHFDNKRWRVLRLCKPI